MKDTRRTHFMRVYDLKTACGEKAADVMYTTWFARMVTCPACESELDKRKKKK